MPQPGDLILYPVTGKSWWVSRLIGAVQLIFGVGKKKTLYSHVAIFSQEHRGKLFEFESRWPRSGQYPVDTSRPFEIWELLDVDDEKRSRIIRWCVDHQGERYPLFTLVSFGIARFKHEAVCSQWAARAYASVGIHFSKEGERIVSPDVMPDSKKVRLLEARFPSQR